MKYLIFSFLYPARATVTAWTSRGTLSSNFSNFSDLIVVQLFRNSSHKCFFDFGHILRTFLSISSYNFSIGLRSGDCGGHTIVFNS